MLHHKVDVDVVLGVGLMPEPVRSSLHGPVLHDKVDVDMFSVLDPCLSQSALVCRMCWTRVVWVWVVVVGVALLAQICAKAGVFSLAS